jgi:hypothetical protein
MSKKLKDCNNLKTNKSIGLDHLNRKKFKDLKLHRKNKLKGLETKNQVHQILKLQQKIES